MVTAGGRIFYIQDESPVSFGGLPGQWRLIARDAFNGKLLWKKDMFPWGDEAWSRWGGDHIVRASQPYQMKKRLVAGEGLVFVTLLALLVWAILERACAQRGLQVTADRLRGTFASLQAVDLTWTDGSVQRRASEMTASQAQVLNALGWPLPETYARLST